MLLPLHSTFLKKIQSSSKANVHLCVIYHKILEFFEDLPVLNVKLEFMGFFVQPKTFEVMLLHLTKLSSITILSIDCNHQQVCDKPSNPTFTSIGNTYLTVRKINDLLICFFFFKAVVQDNVANVKMVEISFWNPMRADGKTVELVAQRNKNAN